MRDKYRGTTFILPLDASRLGWTVRTRLAGTVSRPRRPPRARHRHPPPWRARSLRALRLIDLRGARRRRLVRYVREHFRYRPEPPGDRMAEGGQPPPFRMMLWIFRTDAADSRGAAGTKGERLQESEPSSAHRPVHAALTIASRYFRLPRRLLVVLRGSSHGMDVTTVLRVQHAGIRRTFVWAALPGPKRFRAS